MVRLICQSHSGGFMRRLLAFALALLLFTQNVFAETELDLTDISFKSNQKFIASLSNVLSQDYDVVEVQKGLKPFNGRSVGYRADNFDTLIKKLPFASNDLIQSAKQLGVLSNPKLLVKLQEEIYFASLGEISADAEQDARLGKNVPMVAAMALISGVIGDNSGGGGSGANIAPANPQVSISLSSASFSENGGSTNVTLTLDRAIESDLEVTLGFSSNATGGTDFTSV
ncbi:MAG: hypothetical protein ACPG3T_07280, partial [Pseudomonadales bacterium]